MWFVCGMRSTGDYPTFAVPLGFFGIPFDQGNGTKYFIRRSNGLKIANPLRNKHIKPAILAIESSCDDTGAAVWLNGRIASNVTASQEVHQKYGGVVPEVASRAHQIHLVPVVDAAIREAGIDLEDLGGIGFTRGPGLIGSLMVGLSFAKSLALSLGNPAH